MRIALAIAAGFGGAVALVVAYRRQEHLERDDAGRRSRYSGAAQQLGDPQPAVRLAGVYAMANLADEWEGPASAMRDVLCAYLRLPWSGDSGQIEPTTTTTEQTWPAGDGQHVVTRTYAGRASEREVRRTLCRIIAEHLRGQAPVGWSELRLDFTSAVLADVDFSHARISATSTFRGATFSSDSRFSEATFAGDVRIDGVTFSVTPVTRAPHVAPHPRRCAQKWIGIH